MKTFRCSSGEEYPIDDLIGWEFPQKEEKVRQFDSPSHSSKDRCFDPRCPDERCVELIKNKNSIPCGCSDFTKGIYGRCVCKGQLDWSLGSPYSYSELAGPGEGKLSCLLNKWDMSDYMEIWEQQVGGEIERGYDFWHED